ncbi:unnamed protein product [Closterium sp. NIES-54]
MKANTLAWAVSYLRSTWPFWDRSNGSDHVFVTNDDWGNCDISVSGERDSFLANSITLTLWGLTQNMNLEDAPNRCFKAGQDVAIPPMMVPDVYKYMVEVKEMVKREMRRRGKTGEVVEAGVAEGMGKDAAIGAQEEAEEERNSLEAVLSGANRTTLLYFKGWPADKATSHGSYHWSFGVRQEMFKLFGGRFNETGVLLESTEGFVQGYLVEMQRAVFCLAPSGWGWGMRTTQALMLGCIPVIIQPHVVQPFEGDGTDWSRLAVILSKADIPHLPRILSSIPDPERRAKRRAMLDEWVKFVWASTQLNPFGFLPKGLQDEMAVRLEKGDVFATVMSALRRRLEGKGGGRGEDTGLKAAGAGAGAEVAGSAESAGAAAGAAAGAKLDQQQRQQQRSQSSASLAAQSVSGGSCNEACYTHGTCNEELKRCDCPPGLTGKDCSDRAMPSCHVAPGYWTPCGVLSSCECALECERAGVPPFPLCLDESEGGEGRGGEGGEQGGAEEGVGRGEGEGSAVGAEAKEEGSQGEEEAEDPALSQPAWQRAGWQGLSSLLKKPVVWMATDGAGGETGARERVGEGVTGQQSNGVGAAGAATASNPFPLLQSLLLPSECPGNCSGLGVCLASKQCMCPPMLSGPSCARLPSLLPFTCLNECHSRGVCVHGFCICNPGYFGIDCSLSKAGSIDRTRIVAAPPFSWPEGLSLPTPAPATSPLIYIYDLPPHVTSWSLLLGTPPSSPLLSSFSAPSHSPGPKAGEGGDDGGRVGGRGGGEGGGEWERGAEGVEAVLFLERLLRSPYRTADPYAAHFFLIPVLPWAGEASILRAVYYVRRLWPFWSNSNGANHLILTTITAAPAHSPLCSLTPDKSRHPLLARCSLLAIPVADTTFPSSPLIQVSPETDRSAAAAASPTSSSGNESSSLPCFLPSQDILLPPALPPIALTRSLFTLRPPAKQPTRGTLLLFSDWGVGEWTGENVGGGGGGEGSGERGDGGVKEVRDRVMGGLKEEAHKGKVIVLSQDRENQNQNRDGSSSSNKSGSGNGDGGRSGSFGLEAVVDAALGSVFCLVLPGWTHTMEAPLFVLHGCIPVFIQRDEEGEVSPPQSLQNSTVLDWSDLSLTLPASQAHVLVTSLLKTPQEDIDRRREEMGKIWSKLVWTSPSFNPLVLLPGDDQRRLTPLLAADDVFQAIVAKLQKRSPGACRACSGLRSAHHRLPRCPSAPRFPAPLPLRPLRTFPSPRPAPLPLPLHRPHRPPMAYTRCLSLPVIAGFALIAFVAYTAIFLVVQPWLGLITAAGVLNVAALCGWTTMVVFSYMLSIFRDPGSVPAHYVPDAEGDAEINAEAGRLTPVLVEVKRKGGEARYCQKCGAYKPARCHHCRICKRCVLRMDHHCVWINNCVGHANYKAFFLFVLYDVIALTHTVALLIAFFISSWSADPLPHSSTAHLDSSAASTTTAAAAAVAAAAAAVGQEAYSQPALLLVPSPVTCSVLRALCLLVSLPLLIALVVLLVWHCYLIAINKTTIEHYEGVRARLVSPRPVVPSQPPPSHPYDLGIIANLSAILGPEALCWLCPNDTRHISDGLHFDTAYSISRRSQLSLNHHTGHLDHVDRLL